MDVLRFLVSTDGEAYNGWYASDHDRTWRGESVDLARVPGIGSVLGFDRVWVAFLFSSDESVNWEGAFVDDVELRAEVGAAPPTGPSVAYLPLVSKGWRARKDPYRETLARVQQAMPGLVVLAGCQTLDFSLDLEVIDKSTVDVTNWSKDSAGADITRTGTFARCNQA